MSSIQVEVAGDYSALLKEIARLENVDTEEAMAAIGEGLRESTVRRFDTSTAPDGKKWKTSIRVKEKGGKTLLNRANLRNSIHTEYDATGMAVGTNSIYAATHQFGDPHRVIRAKKKKRLKFQVNGQWVSPKKVAVNIPARPFLGISEEDDQDIRSILDSMMKEK